MKTPKIQGLRTNLGTKLKAKKQAEKKAQALINEAKFQATVKEMARSLYPKTKIYTLQIGEAQDKFVAKDVASQMQWRLDITNSDWAPWSYVAKHSSK